MHTRVKLYTRFSHYMNETKYIITDDNGPSKHTKMFSLIFTIWHKWQNAFYTSIVEQKTKIFFCSAINKQKKSRINKCKGQH